jgi:outer membrane protein TolC
MRLLDELHAGTAPLAVAILLVACLARAVPPDVPQEPANRPAAAAVRQPDLDRDTAGRREPIEQPPTVAPPILASPKSILSPHPAPIDLDSALRLAGVRNPQLLLARERVAEAVARRQLAAAQILPDINLGTNYDNHSGNLQRSTGDILSVHRQDLYLGAGAFAVGSGTVNIPGVVWNAQVSDAIYSYLRSQQRIAQRAFARQAAENDILLQVAQAYEELLRAEGLRAIAVRVRDDAAEVARLTAAYAQTGQGRMADANRAATALERRQYDILDAEGNVLTASAKLNQLLGLDPATQLHAADPLVIPMPVVPDTISQPELIAMALLGRPELKERQAAFRQALLTLDNMRALPFTPTVIVGFSAGTFGGGSNLATTELGDFDGRTDFDVVAYWTLRNLGVGNRALYNAAASRVRSSNYRQLQVLDRVRDEVAEAYARSRARFSQIDTSQQAVAAAQDAFAEDLRRIRGAVGLPIEVLDSLRLLGRGRNDYLNAIVDFNRAQLELYVALGQPAAEVLAHVCPAKQTPTLAPAPNNAMRPAEEVPAPRPVNEDENRRRD